LITFYAIVHTIGHLNGTMKVISEEEDIQKANDVLLHHEFGKEMSYAELLFTTIPGVTG
jgi:hypothetical protein